MRENAFMLEINNLYCIFDIATLINSEGNSTKISTILTGKDLVRTESNFPLRFHTHKYSHTKYTLETTNEATQCE